MNNVRPVIPTNNNSALSTRLADATNSNHTNVGNGLGSIHGSSGNVLHVKDTPIPSYVNYVGPYDVSGSYSIDDVVYVNPNGTYPAPIPPGSYICIKKIPSAKNNYNLFLSSVVPAYTSAGSVASDAIANSYRWPQYNNYFPTTANTSSIMSIIDSGFTIQASQSFWVPVGGAGSKLWAIYDESASYSVGDEVILDPNKSPPYTVQGPYTSSAPLCYGLFQCLVPVPAYNSGSPDGGRNTGSAYYPIYPMIPSGSQVTYSGSVYNQNFWQAISPQFKASFCSVNVWVNGVISGSQFNSTLPYP